jgi:hypothetical protein
VFPTDIHEIALPLGRDAVSLKMGSQTHLIVLMSGHNLAFGCAEGISKRSLIFIQRRGPSTGRAGSPGAVAFACGSVGLGHPALTPGFGVSSGQFGEELVRHRNEKDQLYLCWVRPSTENCSWPPDRTSPRYANRSLF